ncbi:MAG: glycoside hydrolase family 3 [Chloroflexi bacterium]|nr:MAG: glycoside hydrolase family 3 [Chloroflexota bacterium]
MDNRITRRRFVLGGGLGAAALVAGCASNNSQLFMAGSAVTAVHLPQHSPARPPLGSPLRAHLPTPDVPLEVKIGQMIMLGFRGRYLTDESMILRAVRDQHVGSVVLFRYNVQAPDQLIALTATLQAAASRPLLIAIDHEGGLVNRFAGDFGFASNLSAQELGARNDLAVTRTQSENAAQRLAAFGVNLNLAPVVDLNLNPRSPAIGGVYRSFSADPTVVTEHARAVIESHRQHNVFCTLKHFPGHGSARTDSHLGFVDVSDTWQESELTPYQNLVQDGLCDAVMTAHIFNANLDATHPATLSQPIISGILRQQLGYDGVVITDDMQMRAISRQYDFETAVHLAVEAGVDILAIANNLVYAEDWAARTIDILHTLVEQGKVSAERIDQSYRRIMRLKARLAPPAQEGDIA